MMTDASPFDSILEVRRPLYAGLGVLGATLAGWVTITTPEAQTCQIELADAKETPACLPCPACPACPDCGSTEDQFDRVPGAVRAIEATDG